MEQLHGDFATYLHNTHIAEYSRYVGTFNNAKHTEECQQVMTEIVTHEDSVIDYVFEGETSINDITPGQLKLFIRARANEVLVSMGMPEMYDVSSNPIAEWFYRGFKSIKSHDFFSAGTSQYKKTWKVANFSRLEHMKRS